MSGLDPGPVPVTPEDELESAIWAAMAAHCVTCENVVPFLDAIKYAARLYAAGDSESLTAMRRQVLHREVPRS